MASKDESAERGAGQHDGLAGREGAAGIQVIARAARILRALQGEHDGLSLGQIAQKVDLPRSTVQRIVGALATERLLMAASPTGRVRLGPEILALAADWTLDVVQLAHPHLKALAEATGETVDLSVLRDDHLLFVDQVAGPQRLRAVSAVGEVFPLHSTANGKASLALLDDETVRTITAGKLADAAPLLAELAEIRRTGLAFDPGEHTPGISAIGAAFRDPRGSIYALSVPAPSARMELERRRLEPLLIAARDRVASVIGG